MKIGYQIRAIALAGVVFTFVTWGAPGRSRTFEIAQAPAAEATQGSGTAMTAEDPEIPVDELKLLVKPLTLPELEIEAAAWQVLLRSKVEEISNAEIAIKRQNRQARQSREAVDAIEKAQKALEDAQEAQQGATPGSPEYEEASKKVEQAQEALKTAQEAVGEAVEAKEALEEDEQAQEAIEAALEEDEEGEEPLLDLGETPNVEDAEEAAEALEDAAAALEETVEEVGEGEGEEGAVAGADDLETEEELEERSEALETISEQLEESAEATAEVKQQLVVNVTQLQSERTAVVDRFEVILDEMEEKGGDVQAYKTYIDAISGIEIDVTDTEGLGVRVLGWIKSEEGGQRWGINIAKFVGIMIAAFIVSKILRNLANRALAQLGTSQLLREFIVVLIDRGGIIVGFMLALTALEISLGPVLALVGGASFVLAFALQSNLGNLASGLMIMVNKPFDVGDEVKVCGVWGYIHSISLASTIIQGFQRQLITIPNNTIWGGMIENLTPGKGSDIRAGSFLIRSPLNQNIRKVQEILKDVLLSHPKVLKDPGPGVFPWQFEEYFVSLYVSYKSTTDDFWYVWMDVVPMIQERFEKEGLVFAIPTEQEIAIDSPFNGKKKLSSAEEKSLAASGTKLQSKTQRSADNGNESVGLDTDLDVEVGPDTAFDLR